MTPGVTMHALSLFAATEDRRWRPGIGDPTPLGWLTVMAYFVAAGLCLRAASREPRRLAVFWLGLTALLVALGVNKQLDLQTWLTQTARDLLRSWGEYERRRVYQKWFVAGVGLAGLAGFAVFLRLARSDLRSRWPAVAGVLFLAGFVVVRAASFHHVNALLAATIGGLRWNWVLELGGIGLVAVGAARVRRPAVC